MLLEWTLIAVAALLILGGLFAVLLVIGLSRSAGGGDVDWQLARIERKLDLILTNLGIGHDEHVPSVVVELVRLGKTAEAIAEYRRLTGARQSVAQREIDHLASRAGVAAATPEDDH
ncbi:hypothetical protein [Paludisphaera soli]|uniref:hypothetical protein n=1 Tax=Paludisphaera soli TaxID=2712865 RepID=UPI0013ED2253|nr:hypothetical protein [Paludisphaera soli]